MSSKLLIEEHPLQVLPSLAKKYGLNEAIFLQQLHYWMTDKKTVGVTCDNRRWIKNSARQWREDNFPFWSEDTIQRTIKVLVDRGVLLTRSDLNPNKFDKAKWYTLDYEELDRSPQDAVIDTPQDAVIDTGQDAVIDTPKVAVIDADKLRPCLYTETTTEITTETTTEILPPARASAEKTEPEQPAPTPVPVPVPVVVPVDQPTLYDGLPDSAPEKQEHLRLLGMTTKEREDKRSGHRPRHPNPMVNDQGLTQKLRTEMVNILARIHGHTALLEADEEYVLLYQDMAERLYRIRDMREDTIAKLEAFSDLYDARKRDRWGPPVKNQFLEFVSAIYEERLTGQTNGGGKPNARTNGKAGTKHESTATGLVDAYIAEHGPIDINTPYPPGYRQWPDAERERFFELKYPPQLLPEVSGGVEGE